MKDVFADYHQRWIEKLTKLSQMNDTHRTVVEIAESCFDQMTDLMPGCTVRIIIQTPDMEAHRMPEKGASGNGGVFFTTTVPFSETSQLLITTEQ